MKIQRRLRENDQGDTLIEILISVMLLGLIVTAMFGALLVLTQSSVLFKDNTKLQNSIRNWSEQVSSASYVACATPSDIPAAASLPSGISGSVTAVKYWNGSAFVASCPGSGDQGLQQVTLTMDAAASLYPGFSRQLSIVKRKPCGSGC